MEARAQFLFLGLQRLGKKAPSSEALGAVLGDCSRALREAIEDCSGGSIRTLVDGERVFQAQRLLQKLHWRPRDAEADHSGFVGS